MLRVAGSWLYRHSMSLALAAGACAALTGSYAAAESPRVFLYDLLMTIGGGCLYGALYLVLSRPLYEEKADPAKPAKRAYNARDGPK